MSHMKGNDRGRVAISMLDLCLDISYPFLSLTTLVGMRAAYRDH